MLGTAAYMSPEQADGRKVDARSDIFSFGSVLYEMVTGRKPFTGDSRLSMLSKILNEDPEPPSQLAASIPPDLERIILRCLRKDPARRYQTAADLKVALEDVEAESASGKRVRTLPRWHWVRVAVLPVLLFTGVVAALVLGLWPWFPRTMSTKPELTGNPVPLTSYQGRETDPSFSPDGTQVAFVWDRDNNWDIFVKQIGVEEPFRLTRDPAEDRFPVWSPDGGHIAFIRAMPTGGLGLMLVPQRGGPERLLAEFSDRPSALLSLRRVL